MLEGKPAGENDQVTMNAIKSILADYEDAFDGTQAEARPVRGKQQTQTPQQLENLQPVQPVAEKLAGVYLHQPDMQSTAVASKPQKEQQTKQRVYVPFETVSGWGSRVLGTMTPRRVGLAILVCAAVVAPRLIAILALMAAILGLCAFALLGADRIWGFVFERLSAYKQRAPESAERLSLQLSSWAAAWDSVLDLVPGNFVDALYLPDFANFEQEQAARNAAIDARLARMHHQA